MWGDPQKQKQNQDNNQIKTALKNLHELQNQPEFQFLIQSLTKSLVENSAQLSREINQPNNINPQEVESIRNRCQRMINKNQKFKENILIVKAKLRQSLSDSSYSGQDFEQTQITEKVKQISSQVKGKILLLKQKRYINKQKAMRNEDQITNAVDRRSKQKMLPLTISVEQMKKGTQFMFKQIKTVKYDLEITENYLKFNQQTQSKKRNQFSSYY